MQKIPSKLVSQNSAVAYNASIFIISIMYSRHSLELLKSCTLFKNYRLGLLIFQPRQTDFSQISFLPSFLLLQLRAGPLMTTYSIQAGLVWGFFCLSEQQLRKPTNTNENTFPVTILWLTSGIYPLLQPIYSFIPPSKELQLPLETSTILPLVTCNCKHGHSHILVFPGLTILSYMY